MREQFEFGGVDGRGKKERGTLTEKGRLHIKDGVHENNCKIY
jgi:hypothetical protein